MKEQLKGAWKSWTIWFNTMGLLLLQVAMSEPLLLEYMTDKGLVVVIIAGNMILRFKTMGSLADKNNVSEA